MIPEGTGEEEEGEVEEGGREEIQKRQRPSSSQEATIAPEPKKPRTARSAATTAGKKAGSPRPAQNLAGPERPATQPKETTSRTKTTTPKPKKAPSEKVTKTPAQNPASPQAPTIQVAAASPQSPVLHFPNRQSALPSPFIGPNPDAQSRQVSRPATQPVTNAGQDGQGLVTFNPLPITSMREGRKMVRMYRDIAQAMENMLDAAEDRRDTDL